MSAPSPVSVSMEYRSLRNAIPSFVLCRRIFLIQIVLFAASSAAVIPFLPADTATGTLIVTSRPPGAQLLINGATAGSTPLRLEWPAGRYQYRLQLFGHVPSVDSIGIRQGKETVIDDSLFAEPVLTVKSMPEGASVYIDSLFVGKTPIDSIALEPGPHRVLLKREGYRNAEGILQLSQGKKTLINRELIPLYGFLSLDVTPADAAVTIDGNSVSTGGFERLRLPAGWHTVNVTHPMHEHRMTEQFYMNPGVHKEYAAPMDKFSLTAAYRSMLIPGLGQMMDKSYVKGAYEFISFAGLTGLLLSAQTTVTEREADLDIARIKYQGAATESEALITRAAVTRASSDLTSARNKVTMAAAGVVTVYLLIILDAVLNHSTEERIILKNVSPVPALKMETFGSEGIIGIGVHFDMKQTAGFLAP